MQRDRRSRGAGRRRWLRLLMALVVITAAVLAVAIVQPLAVFGLTSRVWPRIVWRVPTSQPLVALTFDDGPAPGATLEVLALLAHHHAHATFFLIGDRAAAYPELVATIREGGHEVGNHSYGIGSLFRASDEAFAESLLRADRVLALRSGQKLFRPPGGLVRSSQVALAEKHGYRCVLGSAYPYDPMRPPPGYVRWLVTKNLAPGVVVILHDGISDPSGSLAVLDSILNAGEQRGLQFVTVSELLAARE